MERHRAIARIFDQVAQKEKGLELQLRQAEQVLKNAPDREADISAALADDDRLAELGADTCNLGASGELFQRLNTRLYLRFDQTQPKKRMINKVAGGVVTFGSSPPPVGLYEGPTGRRALQGKVATPGCMPGLAGVPAVPCGTDREGQPSGNLNPGEPRSIPPRLLPDVEDAARLDHVQPQGLGASRQLGGFGAGVEPDLADGLRATASISFRPILGGT